MYGKKGGKEPPSGSKNVMPHTCGLVELPEETN
jgi:hypothetical protein